MVITPPETTMRLSREPALRKEAFYAHADRTLNFEPGTLAEALRDEAVGGLNFLALSFAKTTAKFSQVDENNPSLPDVQPYKSIIGCKRPHKLPALKLAINLQNIPKTPENRPETPPITPKTTPTLANP